MSVASRTTIRWRAEVAGTPAVGIGFRIAALAVGVLLSLGSAVHTQTVPCRRKAPPRRKAATGPLDPDSQGKVVWERRVSSGGPLGGVEFGPASDGDAYYVGISDIFAKTPGPGMYAFRVRDGALLWSAPGPKLPCAWKTVYCSPAISQAVTAMPGAVFAGAMNGRFRAYDAKTGKILWEQDTGVAPVRTVSGKAAIGGVMDGAGPTIAGGTVYVTSGYQGRSGAPGMVLMAFSAGGR